MGDIKNFAGFPNENGKSLSSLQGIVVGGERFGLGGMRGRVDD